MENSNVTPLIKKDKKVKEENSLVSSLSPREIVSELDRIKATSGPDAIAGISSARTPNEENYLMQKMLRVPIGTNNIR